MGDSAYDFLGMITDSAGGSASDRMAFKVYALQRLHAANFRGVAAVINSRPVIRTGPGVPFTPPPLIGGILSNQQQQWLRVPRQRGSPPSRGG